MVFFVLVFMQFTGKWKWKAINFAGLFIFDRVLFYLVYLYFFIYLFLGMKIDALLLPLVWLENKTKYIET